MLTAVVHNKRFSFRGEVLLSQRENRWNEDSHCCQRSVVPTRNDMPHGQMILRHALASTGRIILVMAVLSLTKNLLAEPPFELSPVTHKLGTSNLPPGVLGRQRLLRGGEVGSDYFQPVKLIVPTGVFIVPADSPAIDKQPSPAVYGLQVGRPYRFRISHIPLLEETELYPSIELIDRLHPPTGMEVDFAVPIELSVDDLRLAADGRYITRVIYVEDPDLALPVSTSVDTPQRSTEVGVEEDPLAVADQLGRPIAVVRLGSKSPGPQGPDEAFLFGSPPVVRLGRGDSDSQIPFTRANCSNP